MIKPRDYQERGIEACLSYLKEKNPKPAVVVHPTGSGKSVLIGCLLSKINEPVLVLQPNIEILTQNHAKLLSYGGEASIFSASANSKELGHKTFATLGSIYKMADIFKKMGVKIVLVDECDNGYPPEEGSMFTTFINELNPTHVIGFTATPFRLKQYGTMTDNWSQLNMLNRALPRFFSKIINLVQIQEMVERKYWAEIQYELWDFDESQLRLNSTGSDFTAKSISTAVSNNGINNNIYLRCKKLLEENKTAIVFMDSVENAKKLASKLGSSSVSVDASTNKKDREKIVKDFKERKINIAVNYGTLGVGFDAPFLDVIIIGRPTNSLANLYQWIGRVVRNPLYPEQKKAIVIDFCNNIKRFGKIETLFFEDVENHGWTLFSKIEGRDKVITGVPMGTTIFREDLFFKKKKVSKTNPILTFGKYEGEHLDNVPVNYKKWLLENIDNFKALKGMEDVIKQSIINGNDSPKTITAHEDKLIVIDLLNVSHILYKGKQLSEKGLNNYKEGFSMLFRNSNIKVVCDGRKADYWRKRIYPEYKANRDDKNSNDDFMNKLFEVMNLPEIEKQRHLEADDIIAEYVRDKKYKEVIVVSSDSDFGQLAFFSRFRRFNPLTRKEVKITRQEALESLITKVIKGDAKDNIKKSHNERAIKTSIIQEITQSSMSDIWHFVKANNITEIEDVNIGQIIFRRTQELIDIYPDKFSLNFRLLNLMQNEYKNLDN